MLIHFLQYDRVYKIWIDFCAENGLNEFDAGHESVTSCLSLVMSESGSISKVSMLSAAIANEHHIRMKISVGWSLGTCNNGARHHGAHHNGAYLYNKQCLVHCTKMAHSHSS
jgi:hypothetical protein